VRRGKKDPAEALVRTVQMIENKEEDGRTKSEKVLPTDPVRFNPNPSVQATPFLYFLPPTQREQRKMT